MKFSTKIIALAAVILLMSSVVVTYAVYTSSLRIVDSQIRDKLESQAAQGMDKLDRVLFERYADMNILASDPIISSRRSTPGQITERLNEYISQYQYFTSLSFFDLGRVRKADTSGSDIGGQHPFNEYWPAIAKGDDLVMVVAPSSVSKEVVIYFASVVKDKERKPFGVIAARMPVSHIYEIAEGVIPRPRASDGLRVELVNKDGLMLYSNYNAEGILKEKGDDWAHIRGLLLSGGITGSSRHVFQGEEEITAFARERGYRSFRGNDWTLVLCTPAKEAFVSAIALRNKVITIGLFICAATLAALIPFSRSISAPISRLSRAAAEIGKGNLDIRVDVTSGDEIGELAQAFNKMAADIKENESGQKKAEEGIRRAKEELERTFDSITDPIMIVDKSHRIIKANKVMADKLKTTPAEVEGLICYRAVHNTEGPPSFCPHAELLADGRPHSVEIFEPRLGGYYTVSVSPIYDPSGELCGSVHYAKDITLRKHAEDEARRLNEELERKVEDRTRQLKDAQEELVRKEKLSVLGQLAASVGHELRNPLGVISNAVYFLKSVMPEADDTVKEYLGIIKSEVDNSGQIISDLLDFSRAKAPQRKLITVNELIRQGLKKCTVPGKVSTAINIPEMLPEVSVDPLQMTQVFQNLVTNAVQAMPSGGDLRITAQFAGAGPASARLEEGRPLELPLQDFVEISVADTGEGISPEDMQNLFQPLFTTKARGIGLGLTVSKRLAEANGGKISVESTYGKGTTITVTLPTKSVPPGNRGDGDVESKEVVANDR